MMSVWDCSSAIYLVFAFQKINDSKAEEPATASTTTTQETSDSTLLSESSNPQDTAPEPESHVEKTGRGEKRNLDSEEGEEEISSKAAKVTEEDSS